MGKRDFLASLSGLILFSFILLPMVCFNHLKSVSLCLLQTGPYMGEVTKIASPCYPFIICILTLVYLQIVLHSSVFKRLRGHNRPL